MRSNWILRRVGYVFQQIRRNHSLQERIDSIPIERYRNFSIVAHVDHGNQHVLVYQPNVIGNPVSFLGPGKTWNMFVL